MRTLRVLPSLTSCLGLAALLGLLACASAEPEALSPAGSTVQTGQDVPTGLCYLGPVVVSSGGGCGLFARRGSYEAALAELRNVAAERGATFVKIESVVSPHDDQGCTTGAYEIHGIGFASGSTAASAAAQASAAGNPAPTALATPASPAPAANSAPAASTAPTAATVSTAPASLAAPVPPVATAPAGADATCTPPCSPGFNCESGRCTPQCNPACAAGEVCNNHRTCEPAPAPRAAPGSSP